MEFFRPTVWATYGSAGKESDCNVGDLSLIPGLGRSPGEGKGYPLQYSGLENSWTVQSMGFQIVRHDWVTFTNPNFGASLVAQTVNRWPAMWVRSLGREDPLEKEMAIHSSTLAWKVSWIEEPDRPQSMGLQRLGHNWATSLLLFSFVTPETAAHQDSLSITNSQKFLKLMFI